jgi:hypothetical protein
MRSKIVDGLPARSNARTRISCSPSWTSNGAAAVQSPMSTWYWTLSRPDRWAAVSGDGIGSEPCGVTSGLTV